ncbi:hypothetical protein IGI04_010980, partial [Brassica rapa subsp. trilocularis]
NCTAIMELSFVNQVRPYRTAWRLQVKVLHTWKQFTPLSGETLEIVLSDAYGNKIHASCKKGYFDRLEKKVPVGAWRNIDHFLVTNNGGSYKTTNHQYKIVFIHTTDITPSTLQEENMFLSLVDFESIQSGKLDTANLIDVIGQVFELGDLETVQCHGKQRKKIEFSLRDISDQKIACCLWGKFAEAIHSFSQQAGEEIVVCLIRFAKIGTYQNQVQISNAFDASQVYFNPPIKETDEFMKRVELSNALTTFQSEKEKMERELRRDKWLLFPQKDIGELLASTQIGQCRIISTIYAIDKDWGWYYFGCNACKGKKVLPFSTSVKTVNGKETKSHVWWCEGCNQKITDVSPKFKIHVMVKDGTGEATLMLLDWTAQGIVPETALNLLDGSFDELEDIDSHNRHTSKQQADS